MRLAWLTKSFSESDHPRDASGEFIPKEEIEAAKTDPAKKRELLARVGSKKEKTKLKRMIYKPDDSGNTGESGISPKKKEAIGIADSHSIQAAAKLSFEQYAEAVSKHGVEDNDAILSTIVAPKKKQSWFDEDDAIVGKVGDVTVRQSGEKQYYGERDGEVVGYVDGSGGTVSMASEVSGLGSELAWQLRSRFPFIQSGGLSDGGRKTLKRVHARMVEFAKGQETTKSIRLPWLVKSGDFTGVSFGRYYINGKQVDKATYMAQAKQGKPQPAAKPVTSPAAHDPAIHAAILAAPGAKKFGLTADVLAKMPPDKVQEMASQMGVAPKAAETHPASSEALAEAFGDEPVRHPSKHNPEITYGNEDDRDSDDAHFSRGIKAADKKVRQAKKKLDAAIAAGPKSPAVDALRDKLRIATEKVEGLKSGKIKPAAKTRRGRKAKPADQAPAPVAAKPTVVDTRSAPTPNAVPGSNQSPVPYASDRPQSTQAVPVGKPNPPPIPLHSARTAAQRLAPTRNGPPPVPGRGAGGFVRPGPVAYPPKLPGKPQPPPVPGKQPPPLPHARTHQAAKTALSALKQANASGTGQQAAIANAKRAIEEHRREGLRHIARLARRKHGQTPKGRQVALATFRKFNANLDRAIAGMRGTVGKSARLPWMVKRFAGIVTHTVAVQSAVDRSDA